MVVYEWYGFEYTNMILAGDSTQPWPFRDNSIDAIITDSPYGLGFMHRAWDIIDEKFHRAWLRDDDDCRIQNGAEMHRD